MEIGEPVRVHEIEPEEAEAPPRRPARPPVPEPADPETDPERVPDPPARGAGNEASSR